MERIEQRRDEETTIDLGSVSDETKGVGFPGAETVGQMMIPGLSDD
jgi:hypothetical protein